MFIVKVIYENEIFPLYKAREMGLPWFQDKGEYVGRLMLGANPEDQLDQLGRNIFDNHQLCIELCRFGELNQNPINEIQMETNSIDESLGLQYIKVELCRGSEDDSTYVYRFTKIQDEGYISTDNEE